MKFTNTLFWGCLHLDHACESWDTPLWKQRGFSSVQDHNESLISAWNKKADQNTVGFLLGDTMFGLGGPEKFLKFIRRLNGSEFFIMKGNHRAGFPDVNVDSVSGKKINPICDYYEAKAGKKFLVLCHYPILSWNKQAHGSYMLYSHVHGNLSKSELGKSYENSGLRCLEVSVEGSIKTFGSAQPFSFEEIDGILSKRGIKTLDHH